MGKVILGIIHLFQAPPNLKAFMFSSISVLMLVISLFMLGFLSSRNKSEQRIIALKTRLELRRELYSSLDKFLENDDIEFPFSESKTLQNGILISSSAWLHGYLAKGKIEATKGEFSDSLLFYFGKSADPLKRVGLVMEDRGDPLVVVGDVKIQGRSCFPKKGAIRSQKFGMEIPSPNCFQSTKSDALDYREIPGPSYVVPTSLSKGIIRTTFFKPKPDKNYRHLIILCDDALIPPGFNQPLQIVAKRSIRIEKGAILDFPSAIAVRDKGRIEVSSGAIIKGIVHCQGSESLLDLDTGVRIFGELYSNGTEYLQGEIYGSVFCELPSYHKSSGRFFSHLVNTRILPFELSEDYCFSVHYPFKSSYELVEIL